MLSKVLVRNFNFDPTPPRVIKDILSREIYDSRGNPTIETDIITRDGVFRAAVPSGASTGANEAVELRDNDMNRLSGKGVLKAVENVKGVIKFNLKGKDVMDQKELDMLMIQDLDHTQNRWGYSKSKLGANAILSVSLALARAGAFYSQMPLYKYLAKLAGYADKTKFVLPVPSFNVINGGAHAGNKLAFQEFMIMPTGAKSFREAMQIGSEVYHSLRNLLKTQYGVDAINVGDEGGFGAPYLSSEEQALEVLNMAINKTPHADKVSIATDIAASEFYEEKLKVYNIAKKTKPDKMLNGEEFLRYIADLCRKFPNLVSIEDPFDQEDFFYYARIMADLGNRYQIVGDDIFVTNPARIELGIKQHLCNSLLLKVNQIGTLTESIQAYSMAREAGWGVMISHRSGETEDTFIADLAVGLGAGQIKTGAPCRSERLAKYNQLLRIEEELGNDAIYAGMEYRYPKW